MSTDAAVKGSIRRVSGPIVHADGMVGVEAYEVVRVGPKKLIGEVLKVSADVATIQVYEQTIGLREGDEVVGTGAPLSVVLAPGLLGTTFDGVQRPLQSVAQAAGPFLEPGVAADPLDTGRKWAFQPKLSEGQKVQGGAVLGTVQETPTIEHRVLVPPQVDGAVVEVVEEGDYRIDDQLCVVETDEGRMDVSMAQRWPVRKQRPFRDRQTASDVLVTGQRVIDTFFPIARGGAAAIPGDFGTGKTMLQHQFAKWSDADIVVYVGCGERGNEMTDILRTFPNLDDPRSGRALMERTVLIGNTSNMPVAAREVSIYTGITIAEYYRDMGYSVALMADSTSRWAEALREASSRLEEMPAEEGFPAYLAARLAEFYERAGMVRTLSDSEGSVTVVGAVSPPGGDFSEPVTEHTTRFTRCFWALDRDLAYSRHYPAISWLNSYSEYLENVQGWWSKYDPRWRALREEMMDLLTEEDKLQQIVKLVGADVLPDGQRLTLLVADMFKTGFLQQNATDRVDTYCEPEKQIALLEAFVDFHHRAQQIIFLGAPIARIRDLDVRGDLVRAKSNIKNGDDEAMHSLLARMDEQLGKLEKEYS